jgi:hypothetical protein
MFGSASGPLFGTRGSTKRHQSSCKPRLVMVSSHRKIQRNGLYLVAEILIQPSIKERGRLAASPFHAIAVVLYQSHKIVDCHGSSVHEGPETRNIDPPPKHPVTSRGHAKSSQKMTLILGPFFFCSMSTNESSCVATVG